MTDLITLNYAETDLDAMAALEGRIAVIVPPEGTLGPVARRVNRLTRGAIARLVESKAFEKLEPAQGHVLSMPTGLAAEALLVIKLPARPGPVLARKAGAAAAKFRGEGALHVITGPHKAAAEIVYGLALRAYDFDAHKTPKDGKDASPAGATIHATGAEALRDAVAPLLAIAEGVFFTRDLTNEPANILTTTEFADRLAAMREIGLKVEVLEEPDLEKLGMRALLGVGQGSRSPSRVVLMEWNGGGDEAPFALVGKGVVFDTGGISIKPAGGMEDMTMDMGGAGVVSGVMRALALRKAKANVVGAVGIVENMPDGNAQRPGDVVRSMKGDTIEIINTDAEGRLVLADVLWHVQEKYKPTGMINLATLTGAIIIGLGHVNAGVFANDDTIAKNFLKAAETEDEGAWRMPMGPAYDKLLKSRIADVSHVGGRAGGSITAAQFLKRFVKDEVPWIHLDIAGVASVKEETDLAPRGATGWGVRALDRLIRDVYEAD